MAERKLLYLNDLYAIPEEIDSTSDTVTLAGVDITNGPSLSSTGINMNGDNISSSGDISFQAVTNTVAGIENQNLVDKTAVETISGNWTYSGNIDFSTGSVTVGGIENQNLVDKTAIETISGNWTYSGNIDFSTGSVTVGGIENQNLVDKSTTETITGIWDFPNGLTVPDSPTGGSYAVNKNYVDAINAGLSWKQSARAASTAEIVSFPPTGVITIDGVSLSLGDRVLIKDQTTTPAQNGVYIVQSGSWTRSTDMDENIEAPGAALFIKEGSVNGDTAWVCTNNDPLDLGTDPVTFVQFTGAGTYNAGFGLNLTGNTFKVLPANIIDTNYGLVGDGGSPDEKIRIKLESDGGLSFDGTNFGIQINTSTTVGVNGSNEVYVIADSIGPTQVDETANYTWTGKHDFSGGDLVVPTTIDGTPNEGSIYWDDKKLYGYDLASTSWVAIGASEIITLTAGEDLSKGQAVYLSASNTVMKSIANSSNSVKTIGIVEENALNTEQVDIRISNIITGLSGLTVGATYYVSPSTAGVLTATVPNGNSNYIVAVGIALSATTLLVDVRVLGVRKSA